MSRPELFARVELDDEVTELWFAHQTPDALAEHWRRGLFPFDAEVLELRWQDSTAAAATRARLTRDD